MIGSNTRRAPNVTRLLLIVLLLLGGAAGVGTSVAHADPRLPGVCVTTTAFTGSMYPYIKGGEHVLILHLPLSWVRKRWVVCYYRETQQINVLHRVIAVLGKGNTRRLIVKGDHNRGEDLIPVTRARYIGVLIWMSPPPKAVEVNHE